MVLEQNLSLVKKVNRLLNWGHWFTFFNIIFALGVTSSFWLSEPLPQTLLGTIYLALNWLGHTAFLCFMFFILTIFPLSLIFPSQKHIRGLGAGLATLGMVLLIFDAYVYNQLGYHIGSTSFDQTVALLRTQIVTNLRNFLLIVFLVGSLILAFQLWISNFCWKKINRLTATRMGQPAFSFLFSSFVLSHLIHVYADANLHFDITRQDNVLPFSYPATAKSLLARYQLVDLTARAQRQAEKLTLPDAELNQPIVACQPTTTNKTLLLVTSNLTPAQHHFLAEQPLRRYEQHFAPQQADEALLNLLYGQFMAEPGLITQLQQAPAWLQSTETLVQIINRSPNLEQYLPWAMAQSATSLITIAFDDQFIENWPEYQEYSNLVVLPLVSNNTRFPLAPVTIYLRWPELFSHLRQQNSQHLDWLPTLLNYAGCMTSSSWLGDNIFAPQSLPKLNISQQDIVTIHKDKMMILRQDGSFGVWSAATLVPLNASLNVPLLVDALKRLE